MWLLPSKERPASLARFFGAYEYTFGSTPGIVIVDQVDWIKHREAYETIALPLGWSWAVTRGVTQGEKLAELWPQIIDAPWLGLIGDDCVPETPGWDRILVNALDGANIVSCNDGWQAPRRLGNCWIMAGDLVRTVGYVFPPGLAHLFVDDVWETIGQAGQCWRCLMSVMVAHRHVLKGEAEADNTHRGVYGNSTSNALGGLWPTDTEAYERWRNLDAQRAVNAVIALRKEKGLGVTVAVDDDENPIERERKVQARLKTRSVLLCTPTRGSPEMEYAESMAETVVLLKELGIEANILSVKGSSNLPRARNFLVAYFRAAPKYTDLVFIDDDMKWDAMSVVRLLAADKDVIGGVGRKKQDKIAWCVRVAPETHAAGGTYTQGPMNSIEVETVGTGLLKITREAFDRLAAERPDLKMDPRDEEMPPEVRALYHRFFYFGPREEGEDYQFCLNWRECGGSVWIDPSITLGHIGRKNYEGTFMNDGMTVAEAA
jgi:hypothetical protein